MKNQTWPTEPIWPTNLNLTYQTQPDIPNPIWLYQTQPDKPLKPTLIYKEYFPTTR